MPLTATAKKKTEMPAPIAGGNTRTYYGYEFATAGQRLSEITQVQNGPDVLFVPYFSAPNVIRHKMLIGNPTLKNERSNAWSVGVVLTPRWVPGSEPSVP